MKTFLATFVILAQIKIGYTTFLIIQPVHVFSPYGGYKWFAYVDASVKYFQSKHLLYALPALVFSATLVVIPLMLLFLYLWERDTGVNVSFFRPLYGIGRLTIIIHAHRAPLIDGRGLGHATWSPVRDLHGHRI